jgi:nicotinamidase-related amidase
MPTCCANASTASPASEVSTLIDDTDSVLVVIDTQPGFLKKVDAAVAAQTVERIAWLVGVANLLAVPVVVTEEEPSRHGSTHPSVDHGVAAEVTRHVKPTFGLAFTPPILAAVSAHGRRTAVLCGLETDVCVAQSAIGLHDLGWKVAVVSDAVAAPGTAHQQGLDRMRDAGVTLIGLKGLYYEWIRRVDRLGSIAGLPKVAPTGIVL